MPNDIATVQPDHLVAQDEAGSTSLMNFVAQAVRDPSIDVTKLEALLRIQREVVADDARTQFNRAMGRLQAVLPRIKKNGTVEYPVDKNKPDGPKKKAFSYARWEDIDTAIRGLMREHGFSLSFNTSQRVGDGGGLVVKGKLLHIGGHAETADFALPLDTSGGKSNLQGYASSTSFGQRYVTKMLLNLVFEGEDDNGQQADVVFITVEQQQEISRLLAETKADLAGFLDYLQAESIESIKAGQFVAAINALQRKKRQMTQGHPA